MATDKSTTATNALKKIRGMYSNERNSWAYIISTRALKKITTAKKGAK